MAKRIRNKRAWKQGFSLIEVLISVCLVAIGVLGLVQLYTMSIMNNVRANEIANAVFLAQQEIDYLRSLTLAELTTFPNSTRGESDDQTLDVNVDGTPDFRRITVVTNRDPAFDVEVLVFPPAELLVNRDELVNHPDRNRVRARMETLITR